MPPILRYLVIEAADSENQDLVQHFTEAFAFIQVSCLSKVVQEFSTHASSSSSAPACRQFLWQNVICRKDGVRVVYLFIVLRV